MRLLIRGRMPAERVKGGRWGWLLDSVERTEFSGLVIAELPGGDLARVLYHAGRLTYLGWKEHGPAEVAEKIRQTAAQATFSVYPFDEARQTLALAAVDGVIVQVFEPTEPDPWAEYRRRHFSGVLALDARAALHVVLFQEGRAVLGAEPPPGLEPNRQTLIAWTRRVPPRLSHSLRPPAPWRDEDPAPPRFGEAAVWQAVHAVFEEHLGAQAGATELRLRRELGGLEADELARRLAVWLVQNKLRDAARDLRRRLSRLLYRDFYQHFE